jgi:hypothetical protein
MAKKIKRFKNIPLVRPISHKEYMELWRSREPERLAREKGLVDQRKLKKLFDLMLLTCLVQLFYLTSFLSLFL